MEDEKRWFSSFQNIWVRLKVNSLSWVDILILSLTRHRILIYVLHIVHFLRGLRFPYYFNRLSRAYWLIGPISFCRPRTQKYAPHKNTSEYSRSFERDIFDIKYFCGFLRLLSYSVIYSAWTARTSASKPQTRISHFSLFNAYIQS